MKLIFCSIFALFFSHALQAQLCQGTYVEMNLEGNSSCSIASAIGTEVTFSQNTDGSWIVLIEGTGLLSMVLSGNNIIIPQQQSQTGFWIEGQGIILVSGANCPMIQLAYMGIGATGGYNCSLLSLVYQGGAGNPCDTPRHLCCSGCG